MHTVTGSDCDLFDMIRNFDPGEASCERLFVDVGMVQDSRPQNVAVTVKDLPPVGQMVPAGVPVRYRHGEVVAAPAVSLHIHPGEVGVPGEGLNAQASHEGNEQDKAPK